jgi:hypothetical protein
MIGPIIGPIILIITSYIREQGCEDPWLFFEARRGQRAEGFAKHCITYFIVSFSRNWNVTSTDCPVMC